MPDIFSSTGSGVMAPPVEMTTAQGYDLQAGTNVIGHYLFTTLLLPALLAASEPGQKARVVTTSSIVHYYIDSFHLEWVVDGNMRRNIGTRELYKNSKFVSSSLPAIAWAEIDLYQAM